MKKEILFLGVLIVSLLFIEVGRVSAKESITLLSDGKRYNASYVQSNDPSLYIVISALFSYNGENASHEYITKIDKITDSNLLEKIMFKGEYI